MKGRNRGTRNRVITLSKQTKATCLQTVVRSQLTFYFYMFSHRVISTRLQVFFVWVLRWDRTGYSLFSWTGYNQLPYRVFRYYASHIRFSTTRAVLDSLTYPYDRYVLMPSCSRDWRREEGALACNDIPEDRARRVRHTRSSHHSLVCTLHSSYG